MAGPHAAGVAALVRGTDTGLNAEQSINVLKREADTSPALVYDYTDDGVAERDRGGKRNRLLRRRSGRRPGGGHLTTAMSSPTRGPAAAAAGPVRVIPLSPVTGQPRVRTYNARRGRLSPLTQARLEACPSTARRRDRWSPRWPSAAVRLWFSTSAAAMGPPPSGMPWRTPGTTCSRWMSTAGRRPHAGCGRPWRRQPLGPHRRRRGAGGVADRRPVPAGVHLFFPDPWPKSRHASGASSASTRSTSWQSASSSAAACSSPPTTLPTPSTRSPSSSPAAFDVSETERPAWRPVDGFEAKGHGGGPRGHRPAGRGALRTDGPT